MSMQIMNEEKKQKMLQKLHLLYDEKSGEVLKKIESLLGKYAGRRCTADDCVFSIRGINEETGVEIVAPINVSDETVHFRMEYAGIDLISNQMVDKRVSSTLCFNPLASPTLLFLLFQFNSYNSKNYSFRVEIPIRS